MSIKMKRMLRSGIVAVCIAAMGCTTTLVYAEPSTEELEQKTNGLQNELNSLNNELNTLGSEMDELSKKIEETSAAMQETQKKMDKAQKKGEEQYEAMKLRIKYMYEAGNSSFIEMLFSAENMTDFLNKTDFIKNVSEYDRTMLQELLETQEEIKKEGDRLRAQQESLADMNEELNSKRADLESQISSKSDQLNQFSAQLARAQEAQRLLEEQRNAAGGIDNSPPVSTEGKRSLGRFKITHYCPCFYCTGSWGGSNTATGTVPTAGRTIAVDPSVIPLGSQVIINGHVYTAEDTGGAIRGKKIDIFVNDHATALAYGVYYAEVFAAQ